MRWRRQSTTSRMVRLAGSSRSSRRRATVTSSAPEASRAASMSSSVRYLPVPRNSRDRSSTPAMTSGSEVRVVATDYRLRAEWTPVREARPPWVGGGRGRDFGDPDDDAPGTGVARRGQDAGGAAPQRGDRGGRLLDLALHGQQVAADADQRQAQLGQH